MPSPRSTRPSDAPGRRSSAFVHEDSETDSTQPIESCGPGRSSVFVTVVGVVRALANVFRHQVLEGLQLLEEALGRDRLLGLALAEEPGRRVHGSAPGSLIGIGIAPGRGRFVLLWRRL